MFGKNKVSLALSSGSAKGIAHIGVIDALVEMGYEISAISGSSAGAFIGAYYAAGKFDELKKIVLSMDIRKSLRLFGINLHPTTGLLNGNKVFSLLNETFDKMNIEDCPIPLYICITSLESGEPVILSRGNIADAVRASISIPSIFEPHRIKGSFYIDGAVSIPLPSHALRTNHNHKIISVDLNHYIKEPTITKPPNVLYTLHRAVSIMSKYAVFHSSFVEESWKIIRPDLSDFRLFDYHKANELIEAGYRITKKTLG